jgi:hypothetical protein
MAHKKNYRTDKTCLNCRHVVENKFCPNCGQENTDSRKTFHHLFVHFFEDLTHYENAFWKTIKNLLFKPATLTKEYLSGKRLSYLAPVRLYIFISFVTFLTFALFSADIDIIKIDDKTSKEEIVKLEDKKIDEILNNNATISKKDKDSLRVLLKKSREKGEQKIERFLNFGYDSRKQLDSLKKFGKGDREVSDFEYWISKKGFDVAEHNTKEEIMQKAKESFMHNFPKVLLIYMPLFAFFLWLFHGKKRWYYFDHGIFTLHYFSFLLLINLIVFLLSKTLSVLPSQLKAFTTIVKGIVYTCSYLWMFYYFFPAHHRFYGESRIISFIKSIILFFINMIFIITILVVYFVYTLINIH